MNVRVKVPESPTGDVVGDLNGKRAKILGMNPEGGINVIDAQVPYSEMIRYSVDLRSMTQGCVHNGVQPLRGSTGSHKAKSRWRGQKEQGMD